MHTPTLVVERFFLAEKVTSSSESDRSTVEVVVFLVERERRGVRGEATAEANVSSSCCSASSSASSWHTELWRGEGKERKEERKKERKKGKPVRSRALGGRRTAQMPRKSASRRRCSELSAPEDKHENRKDDKQEAKQRAHALGW